MITLNATGAVSPVSYHLNQNNRNLQKSLTRLSSGYRINPAVDDPGGLAVSMKLSAAIRRTDAASANVGNALSFLQSQDGVLQVASSLALRMAELATLASVGSVSSNDTALYNKEFVELQANMSDLLAEECNGISLFAASGQTLSVFTSENGTQTAGITKADLDAVENDIVALTGGVSSVAYATSATVVLETAIQDIAELRAINGAEQSRMTFAREILAVNRTNLEAANSRIMDVDIAEESTNFARYTILRESGLAVLVQANTSAPTLLRLLE